MKIFTIHVTYIKIFVSLIFLLSFILRFFWVQIAALPENKKTSLTISCVTSTQQELLILFACIRFILQTLIKNDSHRNLILYKIPGLWMYAYCWCCPFSFIRLSFIHLLKAFVHQSIYFSILFKNSFIPLADKYEWICVSP